MTASPLFYRLRSPQWRYAGLPGATKAYELHTAGLLHLVKDAAGRTGITAAEAERYFSNTRPLSAETKRDVSAATKRRAVSPVPPKAPAIVLASRPAPSRAVRRQPRGAFAPVAEVSP